MIDRSDDQQLMISVTPLVDFSLPQTRLARR